MIPRKTRIALSLALLVLSSQALALPTGGAVASGTAILTTSGNTLTVTNSNNAIINWQGFSIGAGETTRFNQPSASSAVLNRVVSASPSSIFGSLTSNGNVFLVNPNGILLGAGSQVSVGGLTLSTSDITDANFLAANYAFAGGGSGVIRLDGPVEAPAGLNLYAGTTIFTMLNGLPDNVAINGNGFGGRPVGGGVLIGATTNNMTGGGNITLTSSGGITLGGGTIALTSGGTTSGGGSVSLTSGGTTSGGGSVSLTSGGTTSGGGGNSLSAAGSLKLVPQGGALSIPAVNPAAPALSGIVNVISISLNFEKREVAF